MVAFGCGGGGGGGEDPLHQVRQRQRQRQRQRRILCTRSPTGHAVLVDCRFEFPSGEYNFIFFWKSPFPNQKNGTLLFWGFCLFCHFQCLWSFNGTPEGILCLFFCLLLSSYLCEYLLGLLVLLLAHAKCCASVALSPCQAQNLGLE